MTTPDISHIRRRIAETAAWCGSRAQIDDPESSLRTPALWPANRDREPNQWGYFGYVWRTPEDPDIAARAVAALAQRRAELLDSADNTGICCRPDDLAGGRLLIYDPNDTDSSGLSEPETRGFTDVDDVPGWDTWIEYRCEDRILSVESAGAPPNSYDGRRTVEYLLCWIPPLYISPINEGMAVNATECFFWAAEYKQRGYDTGTLRKLDAAGLLQ